MRITGQVDHNQFIKPQILETLVIHAREERMAVRGQRPVPRASPLVFCAILAVLDSSGQRHNPASGKQPFTRKGPPVRRLDVSPDPSCTGCHVKS